MSKVTTVNFNKALKLNLDNKKLLSVFEEFVNKGCDKNVVTIIKTYMENLLNYAKHDISQISTTLGICFNLDKMLTNYFYDNEFEHLINKDIGYFIVRRFSKHFYNNIGVYMGGYSFPIPDVKDCESLWEGKTLLYRKKYLSWMIKQLDNMLEIV